MREQIMQDIAAFNKTVVGLEPPSTTVVKPLTPERFHWFMNCLAEERDEFFNAYQDNDIPGQVDALIDLIYFCAGRVDEMNVPFEHAWNTVHTANMTKSPGNKNRGTEQDAIKPKDSFRPPDWDWLQHWSPAMIAATKIRASKSKDYNDGGIKREHYFPFDFLSYVHEIFKKALRLVSLVRVPRHIKHEPLEDTVLDMINYLCFLYERLKKGDATDEV